MKATLHRHAKARTTIAFLCFFVLTILFSYGASFIASLRNADESAVASLRPKVPPTGSTPKADEASRPQPRTKFSLVVAMATKAADEAATASELLSNELEPNSISQRINFGATSRDDLEALRRELITAENNAATFMPRYLALLKSERDKVERYARSIDVEKDLVVKLLAVIDARQAELAATTSKTLMARAHFYRTYETYIAVLAGDFGTYRIVDGQFIFPNQRTVDRYNVAAHAMAVASKQVAELDEERRRLLLSQREQWLQFIALND